MNFFLVENYEASSSSKNENANIEVVQKGKNVVVKKAKQGNHCWNVFIFDF